MCDESSRSPTERTPHEGARDRVRARIAEVVAERQRLEGDLQDTVKRLHLLLREAHDAGLSWAEIAELAGYRNATVARNQAAPRSPTQTEPGITDGSYTVREAADRLGVSPQTIYQWIDAGRIKVADHRVRGRRVYLPADDDSR